MQLLKCEELFNKYTTFPLGNKILVFVLDFLKEGVVKEGVLCLEDDLLVEELCMYWKDLMFDLEGAGVDVNKLVFLSKHISNSLKQNSLFNKSISRFVYFPRSTPILGVDYAIVEHGKIIIRKNSQF